MTTDQSPELGSDELLSVLIADDEPVVRETALDRVRGGVVLLEEVRDGAAEDRTVTVLGSADGLAVVDGVDAGEQVRVLNGTR